MTERRFPDDFLWGAATAAYQIEGAVDADGRTDSVWDAFCRRPGAVAGGQDGAVACDHYHRMEQDVALMAQMGLGAYRFSVAWPRVRPDAGPVNPAGIDFYSRLVDRLLEAGITPWLTLYHWDLPQVLQERHDGWAGREVVDRFTEYALSVHDALGDRVRHWTTLNEPWVVAFLGHAAGTKAPGLTDRAAALRATHHQLLAHGTVVRELRARDADLDLGITLNFTDTTPLDPDRPADVDAARRIDGLQNRIFVEPITRGTYPADVMEDLAGIWPEDLIRDGDLDVIATDIDVLGVNYYTTQTVTGPDPSVARVAADQERRYGPPSPDVGSEHVAYVRRGTPVTEMGWEVRPEGLRDLLLRLHRDFTGPRGTRLVITENGAAYPDPVGADGAIDDQDRIAYLDAHVRAVHEAITAGADVAGYLAWSLLDNFEWELGYGKRFGLVRVDYDTLERTPKASAQWWSRLCRSGVLPG